MPTEGLGTVERNVAFEFLLDEAQEYLKACQSALDDSFRLGHWPRYDWSQDTRQLVFSEGGKPRVIADVQFVGSISTTTDTWLWSWANDSVDPRLHGEMEKVRAYGEAHGIEQLTTKKWHAHEVDGWEMTSVSAYLLKARGAYRSPKENGFTFMVMTAVGWAT